MSRSRLEDSPAPSTAHMALAAGGGGLANGAVSNPLRVWKTRQQLGHLQGSLFEQARQVPMLAGLGLYCATSVVANVWVYTAQHVLRQACERRDMRPAAAHLVAGVLAGATEALVTNPWRRVLVMQQIPGADGLRAIPALRNIVRTEGVRGLLTGAGAGAARNAVACGLFFPVAMALREQGEPSLARDLGAAIVASAAALAVTTPLDTAASVLQGTAGANSALRALVLEGGVPVLCRGIVPNVAQAAPGTAAAFVTTMAMLRALQKPPPPRAVTSSSGPAPNSPAAPPGAAPDAGAR